MALVHFSKEGFEKAMASGQVVVVDFWAAWCGPCRMLGPVIDKLAEAYDGKAIIGKVNVDEQQKLAVEHGVMSIPTVIVFKDGKEVNRQVGLAPGADPFRAFADVLDKYL